MSITLKWEVKKIFNYECIWQNNNQIFKHNTPVVEIFSMSASFDQHLVNTLSTSGQLLFIMNILSKRRLRNWSHNAQTKPWYSQCVFRQWMQFQSESSPIGVLQSIPRFSWIFFKQQRCQNHILQDGHKTKSSF